MLWTVQRKPHVQKNSGSRDMGQKGTQKGGPGPPKNPKNFFVFFSELNHSESKMRKKIFLKIFPLVSYSSLINYLYLMYWFQVLKFIFMVMAAISHTVNVAPIPIFRPTSASPSVDQPTYLVSGMFKWFFIPADMHTSFHPSVRLSISGFISYLMCTNYLIAIIQSQLYYLTGLSYTK